MDLHNVSIGDLLSEILSREDLHDTLRDAIEDAVTDILSDENISLFHPKVVSHCFSILEQKGF